MPDSLEDALSTLSAAHAEVGNPPTTDQVARWMEALYGVFRAGMATSGRISPELRAHAERTAPLMSHAYVEQLDYVSSLERMLFDLDQHEDWARVCHPRSVIEVVRTLYSDPGGGEAPFTGIAGTESVDDLIWQLADRWGYLRESEIPPEIPTSHWWWWAPVPPPPERGSMPHP